MDLARDGPEARGEDVDARATNFGPEKVMPFLVGPSGLPVTVVPVPRGSPRYVLQPAAPVTQPVEILMNPAVETRNGPSPVVGSVCISIGK